VGGWKVVIGRVVAHEGHYAVLADEHEEYRDLGCRHDGKYRDGMPGQPLADR
jgi:hypothetical protein